MTSINLDKMVAAAPSRSPREQEILDAAAVVFHQKGYDAATIQDVADAVGILKGSLYYYIESKEDLLFQILRDAHIDSLRRLAVVQAVEGDVVTRLRTFIESTIISNIDNHVTVGVFFQDFRSLSEARRAEIIGDRDAYDLYARALIREGQEAGVFAPDLDAKMTAFALMGMMNWVYQWYRPEAPDGISPHELGEAFADFALGGLLARDGGAGIPGVREVLSRIRRAG